MMGKDDEWFYTLPRWRQERLFGWWRIKQRPKKKKKRRKASNKGKKGRGRGRVQKGKR